MRHIVCRPGAYRLQALRSVWRWRGEGGYCGAQQRGGNKGSDWSPCGHCGKIVQCKVTGNCLHSSSTFVSATDINSTSATNSTLKHGELKLQFYAPSGGLDGGGSGGMHWVALLWPSSPWRAACVARVCGPDTPVFRHIHMSTAEEKEDA